MKLYKPVTILLILCLTTCVTSFAVAKEKKVRQVDICYVVDNKLCVPKQNEKITRNIKPIYYIQDDLRYHLFAKFVFVSKLVNWKVKPKK